MAVINHLKPLPNGAGLEDALGTTIFAPPPAPGADFRVVNTDLSSPLFAFIFQFTLGAFDGTGHPILALNITDPDTVETFVQILPGAGGFGTQTIEEFLADHAGGQAAKAIGDLLMTTGNAVNGSDDNDVLSTGQPGDIVSGGGGDDRLLLVHEGTRAVGGVGNDTIVASESGSYAVHGGNMDGTTAVGEANTLVVVAQTVAFSTIMDVDALVLGEAPTAVALPAGTQVSFTAIQAKTGLAPNLLVAGYHADDRLQIAAEPGTEIDLNLRSWHFDEWHEGARVEIKASGRAPAAESSKATGQYDDVIRATEVDDLIKAKRGADLVLAGHGDDVADGGTGRDIVKGGRGDDQQFGGRGHDRLKGGADDDYLNGGRGTDVLRGGAGRDCFVFDVAGNRHFDKVKDFKVGQDMVYLSLHKFKMLDGDGALAKKHFHDGRGRQDENDYIVYDKASGALWYNPDTGSAKQIAQFAEGTDLSHDDILLF